MKLQKLTIKNLASIEDAVIDFENGPLSEESLFLIFRNRIVYQSIIFSLITFNSIFSKYKTGRLYNLSTNLLKRSRSEVY